MPRPLSRLLLSLCLALLGQAALALEVAVIGDKTKWPVAQQIAKETHATLSRSAGTWRATTPDRKTTLSIADPSAAAAAQLRAADLALLVLDATQALSPSAQEPLRLARHARVPAVVVVFANARALDDPELLELQELAARDLLSSYGFDGRGAGVFFDSEVRRSGSSGNAAGLQGLVRFLTSPTLRRTPQPDPKRTLR